MKLIYCPYCAKISCERDDGSIVAPEPADVIQAMIGGEYGFKFCDPCLKLPTDIFKPVFTERLLNLYHAVLSFVGPLEEYPHEPLVNALAFLAACILKTGGTGESNTPP